MTGDNPPRKKWWSKHKKGSQSGLDLTQQGETRTAGGNEVGSRRLGGRLGKYIGKVAKGSSGSAGPSLMSEPAVDSLGALGDPTTDHPSKNHSPNVADDANLVQATSPGTAKVEPPEVVNERIADAAKRLALMSHIPGFVQTTASATDDMQSGFNTFSPSILGFLETFNSVAKWIADIHPYAKAAMNILTLASKMILDQTDRDDAVADLLKKVSEVYTFMTERDSLARIQFMQALYEDMARQTLECVEFIVNYSETSSAWRRLAKDVLKETRAKVQSYSDSLDSLMQKFRDKALRDIVENVHRIGENIDLNGMKYAIDAGLDTSESKLCLPGTREEILSEIKSWIGSAGEDVQRVFWLSGTAGKGKSTIARTIANSYNELGGLGAYFCFDRTQEADRRHEKIFSTIARDLADHNPIMRRELARVVNDHKELLRTKDIAKQWRELILGPISVASKGVAAPVLIVIDAMDESGKADSREEILCLLAGKPKTSPSQLPANLRILVTSRPLDDIYETLHGDSRVLHVSMDDIPVASAERDIELYISTRLEALRSIFNDAHFKTLAQKSDGLFEWARLASEYIKSRNVMSRGPMHRFRELSETSARGAHLLDDIYQRILREVMPESRQEEVLPMFRSVMAQILASLEPLPTTALNSMRHHFIRDDNDNDDHDDDNVELVIGKLGSLLTGAVDPETLIRPLHTSFYDFLTDKGRSDKFFVDASLVRNNLAFASLRTMEHGLRFNICSLESSYLPNFAVPNLRERVKKSIPVELSYSCRFWGTHVQAASFETLLIKEIEAFFNGERLLYWLEALALMKALSGSITSLSSVAEWLMGHAEYMYIGDAVEDTQRFIRSFASTILHSTPHLYLSALPFAPTRSMVFRKFAGKFPRTPQVVGGHVLNWPLMEKTVFTDSVIKSITVSPDGKYIISGLWDGTIQVWDMETGEALGSPLQEDTAMSVPSVAISPDGQYIVSGHDSTIQMWDMKTRHQVLRASLQDHTSGWITSIAFSPDRKLVFGSSNGTIQVWDMDTDVTLLLGGETGSVTCVAISPDGKYVVAGSDDMTIQVLHINTGQALHTPLQGHTDQIESVAISPDGRYIVHQEKPCGYIELYD